MGGMGVFGISRRKWEGFTFRVIFTYSCGFGMLFFAFFLLKIFLGGFAGHKTWLLGVRY